MTMTTRNLGCLILALASTAAPVSSQGISIDLSGFPKAGVTGRLFADTTGHVAVQLGSPGENQVWNFTQTLNGREIPLEVVSPASTPYATPFPTADWAVKSSQWLSLDAIPPLLPTKVEGFFDVYYYQKENPATQQIEGLGIGAVTPFYAGGYPFSPVSTDFVFPLELGRKWTKKYTFSAPAVIGVLSTVLVTKDSTVQEADATGRLTIPYGTFDCVRVKSIRHLSLKAKILTTYIPVLTDTLILYEWYARDAGMLLQVSSHGGEDNPQFTDAGFVARLSSTNAVTGFVCEPECGPAAQRPVAVTLAQNCPNPFNPATVMGYGLPETAQVELSVFDLLGRRVAVLDRGLRPAGAHQARWDGRNPSGARMPSGVYFYRLTAAPAGGGNPFTLTKKMVMTD